MVVITVMITQKYIVTITNEPLSYLTQNRIPQLLVYCTKYLRCPA